MSSKCEAIVFFSVSIQDHPTLNTSRGVVSKLHILFSTKEEFQRQAKENLNIQNVIDLHQITIGRSEQEILKKHIILIFNSPTLPARIKADNLSYRYLCTLAEDDSHDIKKTMKILNAAPTLKVITLNFHDLALDDYLK